MDRPIGIVLSIVLTVVGMIAAGAIMWTTFGGAQQQLEDVNPYSGITVEAVCTAAGGTWDGTATGDKCT